MTAVGTERIFGDFKFNSKQIKYIIHVSSDLPGSVLFTSDNHKTKYYVIF
jgi:hypothetical protein